MLKRLRHPGAPITCLLRALNALIQESKKASNVAISCSIIVVWSMQASHTIQVNASKPTLVRNQGFPPPLFQICHKQIHSLIAHDQNTAVHQGR